MNHKEYLIPSSLIFEKLNKIEGKLEELKAATAKPVSLAISVTEASKIMGCSRTTIRTLWEDGKIDGYQERDRGRIYIYRKSLEEYLNI